MRSSAPTAHNASLVEFYHSVLIGQFICIVCRKVVSKTRRVFMIPRRITIYSLMIVFVLLGTGFTYHSVLADSGPGTCQSFNVPVGLGPGQPDQYTIYGELCNPTSGPSQTVQLLVAGASYSHVYWDFPYQPQTYSYVRALNAVGYS